MRNYDYGRPNMGGMAGAIVGGIGGLFALGLIPAIMAKDVRLVLSLRTLNFICWLISFAIGWFLGGFLGRVLGDRLRSDAAEIIGGIIGGLVPVLLLVVAGWRLWSAGR